MLIGIKAVAGIYGPTIWLPIEDPLTAQQEIY